MGKTKTEIQCMEILNFYYCNIIYLSTLKYVENNVHNLEFSRKFSMYIYLSLGNFFLFVG